MLVLGASGAVAALGDTLFPARSLVGAISEDFSPTAHFLIRLRILHPTIAVIVTVYLILATAWIRAHKPNRLASRLSHLLIALLVLQLGLGLLNVLLLAPIWMQLVHLFVADVIWITLVLLAAVALAAEPEYVEAGKRIPRGQYQHIGQQLP